MPDGVEIPFEDGHVRQLPRLTHGPFRYGIHADAYLVQALRIASVPVKQAVIAPSALSLLYPQEPIDGYPREAFLDDLVDEAEADVRRCVAAGAHKVQERSRIGVHTCPGGDQDSTHSLDAPYSELLPSLFQLNAGNFYIQLASERDRPSVLSVIRDHARPDQRIFIGVIDPIDPRIETPEQIRDRVLEAAGYIPVERLGTTDDCGFAPFGDDTSTPRDVAFAKIRARVQGTQRASRELGV